MTKSFVVTLTLGKDNTSQTWTFDAGISQIEQLALWVILRALCEKQLNELLGKR